MLANAKIDLLLRCLEDEFALNKEGAGMHTYENIKLLSDKWVTGTYADLRVLRQRKLVSCPAFLELVTDLELIRIPLDKHELFKDGNLKTPIETVGASRRAGAKPIAMFTIYRTPTALISCQQVRLMMDRCAGTYWITGRNSHDGLVAESYQTDFRKLVGPLSKRVPTAPRNDGSLHLEPAAQNLSARRSPRRCRRCTDRQAVTFRPISR